MRRRCRWLAEEDAAEAGRQAAGRLEGSEVLARRRRLVLYASLPGELPSQPLYELALSVGLPLLWPRVTGGEGLEFAPCARWEDLRPGRYGVLAPPDAAESRELAEGDLVLVPGVAFDAAGNRLGRGGGHYDRALADRPTGALTFGVGFDFQRVDEVPVGPHDQAVDAVLTEKGIWRSERR